MVTYFTVTLTPDFCNLELIDKQSNLNVDYLKNKLEGLTLVFEYDTKTDQCVLITADNQLVINTNSDIFLDYNPLSLEKV